jgi:hypothetical protein
MIEKRDEAWRISRETVGNEQGQILNLRERKETMLFSCWRSGGVQLSCVCRGLPWKGHALLVFLPVFLFRSFFTHASDSTSHSFSFGR